MLSSACLISQFTKLLTEPRSWSNTRSFKGLTKQSTWQIMRGVVKELPLLALLQLNVVCVEAQSDDRYFANTLEDSWSVCEGFSTPK